MVFGLLAMPAGAPIHVFKNLLFAATAMPQSRWSPRRTTERRHGHAMKVAEHSEWTCTSLLLLFAYVLMFFSFSFEKIDPD